jgi:hypothetical protein
LGDRACQAQAASRGKTWDQDFPVKLLAIDTFNDERFTKKITQNFRRRASLMDSATDYY